MSEEIKIDGIPIQDYGIPNNKSCYPEEINIGETIKNNIDYWKNLYNLYFEEKEKSGILQKELDKKIEALDKAMNNPDYISKDKITSILGLEKETTEQTILQYIETLESENARLEDIEDRKVQIEYELIFNKGAKSVKDKIKEIIYAHEPDIAVYLLKELLEEK
jgi:hypothetical protein